MEIKYENGLPDRDEYGALFETTGWNKHYQASPKELDKAISGSWFATSAYHEDQLVGFGRVLSDGVLYALIADLIVIPKYQGKGIGSNLLDQLLDHCRSEGLRIVWLFSVPGKMAFYERYGFIRRPEDAQGMQLKLC